MGEHGFEGVSVAGVEVDPGQRVERLPTCDHQFDVHANIMATGCNKTGLGV
jgi:hypothetical protein